MNELTVDIIQYSKDYKKIIYLAGRNCYGLECFDDKICDNDLNNFINKVIQFKHFSILEHCYISVFIKNISRSLLLQITRHRLCSFSVKSQHYVNHHDFLYKNLETTLFKNEYKNLMKTINNFYDKLVKNNIPHYIAREILPNSCLTNIFMTANIREWRHIIDLRITNNNTPEIKKLSFILLRNFYLIMPELFIDLVEEYDNDRPDLVSLKQW